MADITRLDGLKLEESNWIEINKRTVVSRKKTGEIRFIRSEKSDPETGRRWIFRKGRGKEKRPDRIFENFQFLELLLIDKHELTLLRAYKKRFDHEETTDYLELTAVPQDDDPAYNCGAVTVRYQHNKGSIEYGLGEIIGELGQADERSTLLENGHPPLNKVPDKIFFTKTLCVFTAQANKGNFDLPKLFFPGYVKTIQQIN